MNMSKKKCAKGWKWMKVGENPKMPYPPCGRSIKAYARGNNDAPSITQYGTPVRLDAQIVALCPHCAKGAPCAYFCCVLSPCPLFPDHEIKMHNSVCRVFHPVPLRGVPLIPNTMDDIVPTVGPKMPLEPNPFAQIVFLWP